MVSLAVVTINLTPPLSGVLGTLYVVYGGVYNKLLDMPLSENGLIQMDVATTSPEADYAIIFPEQTIEGVTYRETETPLFNLLSPVTFFITLETSEPPVPPTPIIEIKSIAIPGIVGAVLMFTILRV